MAVWTKDGGTHTAELGPNLSLSAAREGGAWVAEVFGRQIRGEHAALEDAKAAAEARAREILAGALAALGADPNHLWPRVGVGVAVLTPRGYVLLRRAAGKHGAGEWSFPGGALERWERLAACGGRETLEELGVRVGDARMLPYVSEDPFPAEGQHWITHYVLARTEDEPRNLEPHKCDALFVGWPHEFPRPLFVGIAALAERGLLPSSW